MTDLDRALREVVAELDRMSVPYAVMGGLAVRVYGIPRATYDVDFTVSIPRQRLKELFQRVESLGFTVPEIYESGWVDEIAGMPLVKFRLYLQQHGIDIDVFLAESPFQEELISRRVAADVEGTRFWLVSPEDLILLKLIASRPRDLADIGDVLFTQRQLDEGYMRHWASELGVLPRLEEILRDDTSS